MKPTKEQIIALLDAWIRQRPGLEFGNYGDVASYRAEIRSIGKDLQQARTLLRAVELSSIPVECLQEGFRAFSGRLQIKEGKKPGEYRLEYTTGQYWPTEYRRAACAVLASALWSYYRDAEPDNVYTSAAGVARKADDLRKQFRREFGKAISNRWFN